ncbi:MAG TPA: YbhB/YbcL family Raf kinase inhibitor-like protein [Kofleriaceae bacterium]|nr:YbhB/YbcL family Raf kinase inhibitor-like protein [Kofleriaceae bacterium]
MLVLAAVPVSAVAEPPPANTAPAKRITKTALKVTSSAFGANEAIPAEYTCDGAQKSPPLAWSNVPKNTRAVAILIEDPDAPSGAFTHWLVTGIPPATTSLAAGAPLKNGAAAAKNGKGDTGYSGPCPPSGRHHYFFHVYALDTTIPSPATKEDFSSSINGHVLAEGQLIGMYAKSGTKSAQSQ